MVKKNDIIATVVVLLLVTALGIGFYLFVLNRRLGRRVTYPRTATATRYGYEPSVETGTVIHAGRGGDGDGGNVHFGRVNEGNIHAVPVVDEGGIHAGRENRGGNIRAGRRNEGGIHAVLEDDGNIHVGRGYEGEGNIHAGRMNEGNIHAVVENRGGNVHAGRRNEGSIHAVVEDDGNIHAGQVDNEEGDIHAVRENRGNNIHPRHR